MQIQTYLMSFERMVQLLESNGIRIDRSQVLSLQVTPARLLCDGQSIDIGSDLFEKLMGTWWEVELSGMRERPARCAYLADSLQDALRLRPGIDTSYWCSASETTNDFLSEISTVPLT